MLDNYAVLNKTLLWGLGLGGFVAPTRVVAVGRWESAPIRRAAQSAAEQGLLVDLTYGKACRYVFFMDSRHVVLAASIFPEDENEED